MHKTKIDKDWLEKALKKDKRYFEIQVKKGIERLAGKSTKERVADCIHCKLWDKADKFIGDILQT